MKISIGNIISNRSDIDFKSFLKEISPEEYTCIKQQGYQTDSRIYKFKLNCFMFKLWFSSLINDAKLSYLTVIQRNGTLPSLK